MGGLGRGSESCEGVEMVVWDVLMSFVQSTKNRTSCLKPGRSNTGNPSPVNVLCFLLPPLRPSSSLSERRVV
jgi:hypothetical protein